MTLRPCDICGEDAARTPFRYQIPGGRRAQGVGTRPLYCCASADCVAAAEARWAKACNPARSRRDPPSPPLDLFSL